MGLISNFAEDCPECGSSDWRLHDSNLKCQRCGFVVDPQEVRKEPMDALKGAFMGESKESSKMYQSYSDDLRNRIEDKEAEGLEVLEFERDRVVMGQPEKAGIIRHFVMFILTGWWTLGAGNVAYHEYKKRQYEKIVLRENKQTSVVEESPAEKEPADALRSLEELREEGLVSEEEYESKREDIIQDL